MSTKKRGYFFTLDVLIALIVMVIGFILIWSSISVRPSITQPYFLAQDLIDFMSSTNVVDVSNMPYVTELINNGNISKSELDVTLIEQITLFYYLNKTQPNSKNHTLRNFTQIILMNATPLQYSFEFLLNNEPLYTQQNSVNKLQDDSDSLASAKTIVSVVVNKDTITYPMIAEVRVWQ